MEQPKIVLDEKTKNLVIKVNNKTYIIPEM